MHVVPSACKAVAAPRQVVSNANGSAFKENNVNEKNHAVVKRKRTVEIRESDEERDGNSGK